MLAKVAKAQLHEIKNVYHGLVELKLSGLAVEPRTDACEDACKNGQTPIVDCSGLKAVIILRRRSIYVCFWGCQSFWSSKMWRLAAFASIFTCAYETDLSALKLCRR